LSRQKLNVVGSLMMSNISKLASVDSGLFTIGR